MTVPPFHRMVQRIAAPFLAKRRVPQRRAIILHEILPEERPMLGALITQIDSGALGEITLTFDDGFHSSFDVIRGLERQKAIFFVCPEYIHLAGTNRWQEFFRRNLLRSESLVDPVFIEAVRPASWDDLRELVRRGHTIGSHSMSHVRLSAVYSRKELEREIIGSAAVIEDRLNTKVEYFAYPFGNIDSINNRALAMIGRRYMRCYAGIRGNNARSTNGHIVWRDTVHLRWPMEYIGCILRGGFDWWYALQRREIKRVQRRSLRVDDA